ncbi:MAG: hypothetical protein RBR02_01330 [Desulfuromonadaceae bacterium]|nr:hypothetical protein [Desulfuromonadaceae bacterium]
MKIAAVFGSVGPSSPKEYVERMCQAQVVHQWHSTEVFEVSGGAIGIVRTSERYGVIPMFFKSADGNLLAISGVPTKLGQLEAFLRQIVEMDTAHAFQALTEMDGAYAAIFWQEKEQKALIVPDFMGFQPLYFHKAPKGIALASEIKAFPCAQIVPVQPDPAGWGAFLTFGHSVGENTQLAGVSSLRGKRICYDPANNELTQEQYWNWPERSPEMPFEDISTKFILDCYRAEVSAYQEYQVQDNTLLMSSGFDSRFILCLLKEKGISIETLSVMQRKHFGGAEGTLGHRVAKYFGVEHARLVGEVSGPEGEAAKSHYLMMNEVATPGRGLFISNVAAHVESLTGAVWEGVAPGYTLTQFTDLDMNTYLTKKKLTPDSAVWQQAAAVFSQDFIQSMQEALKANIEREREMYGEDDYGVMRFIIKNRALNRTVTNPLKVYANSVLPFTPGMSDKLWSYIASIPPLTIKKPQLKLYRKIYREHYKKACAIPFCGESGLFSGDDRFSAEIKWKNFVHTLLYYYERRRKIPLVGSLFAHSPIEANIHINDFLNRHANDLKNGANSVSDYVNTDFFEQKNNGPEDSFHMKQQQSLAYYFLYWADVMRGDSSVH